MADVERNRAGGRIMEVELLRERLLHCSGIQLSVVRIGVW